MRTISVAVSETDYEAFRRVARAQHRSTAQLIREAMAFFRAERLEERMPLEDLPVLAGHRAAGELPARAELYDEVFGDREELERAAI